METSQRMRCFVAVCALSSIILGCGGGGSNLPAANGLCYAIATPDAQFSCNNSGSTAVENCPYIFDGDLDDFALLPFGGRILVSAAPGRLLSSGIAPGVYFDAPPSGTLSITITTLLDGVQQETTSQPVTMTFDAPGSRVCSSPAFCTSPQPGPGFVGMRTTKAYDSISSVISITGSQSIKLHEVCAQ